VQEAAFSMPVLTMHETNWDDARELSTGHEMRTNMVSSMRSQDDARVGYMFQRPDSQQTGKVGQQPYASKAWPARDRAALEQASVTMGMTNYHIRPYLTASNVLTCRLLMSLELLKSKAF